jgi:protein-tyrosine phosphatase
MAGDHGATEIFPGLWLGSYKTIQDPEFMADIDVVFNCTKNLPMVFNKKSFRLPVDDNLQKAEIDMMSSLAAEIVFHIHNEYATNRKRVLIHCYAGRQRSAAVVAMYLIFIYGLTPRDAVTFIRSRRPEAFAGGVNFLESISRFRREFSNRCKTARMIHNIRVPIAIGASV